MEKTSTPAAVYTRISLDRTGQQLGVQRQLEDCAALADRLGFEVVEYFSDNDLSAYTGRTRPGFEALLDAMKRGEVSAVICWHTDRLYRSMKDLERLIDVADLHGVQLRTVNGGDLDLSTATGRMLARILGSVSRQESEHKAERQRRAAEQKAASGRPQWRRAFGYLDGPDGPQPDPRTAPLVRQAYAAVLAGASLRDMCELFNGADAVGLKGRPWTESRVSAFLRAPRNAGLRAHNGRVVGAGTWPPLVDPGTWHEVQAVLNAPGRAPGRKAVKRHLLTGVLRCGKCGGHLAGQWQMQPTGGRSGRPKAGERKQHPGQVAHSIAYACKSCRGCSIRAEHVEPMLFGLVGGRLAMADAVDLLRADVHDTAEAEALRIEAEALTARLDGLAVEHAEGLLTARQVKVATDAIAAKLAAVAARQRDRARVRVFDEVPLGSPQAVEAVAGLSADRFRAVLDVLCEITIEPVGKGGNGFRPERVRIRWH